MLIESLTELVDLISSSCRQTIYTLSNFTIFVILFLICYVFSSIWLHSVELAVNSHLQISVKIASKFNLRVLIFQNILVEHAPNHLDKFMLRMS